jgi:hypothetical protein
VAAGYSVYLSTPTGVRLADASKFLKLEYARTVNAIGALTLTLPGTFDTQSIIIPDGRIEVWRRLPSGREYLDTDTVWFIQGITYQIDDQGKITIVVSADSGLFLLKDPGRFVDNYAGSAQATKTDMADDMCKAIVREQAGASASAARSLAAFLSVQADSGSAPSISKAFSWRPVLTVLQEIAQSSFEAGTYLAFDIVSPTPDTLEFQTFVGQRGVDHRFPSGVNPVLLGPDMGNMGETTLGVDYRDEVSYAKAGGSGEGSGRLTDDYLDSVRAAASPFRRRETFVQATNTDTAAALEDEATSAVRGGRPRVILQGKIASTLDTQYGVDWSWGDYVTVQAFGMQLDARVDAIKVTVTPDEENIEAIVRSETYL